MTDLLSAAQAVLDAVREISPAPADEIAATALEAVADQVVPEHRPWLRTGGEPAARHKVRLEILAIASELRGTISREAP